MNIKKNNLLVYQAENGSIQLKGDFNKETIWATQRQMSEVFDVNVRTINEHVKNIIESEELDENQAIRNFRIVQKEGGKMVERNTKHYNLDMIISVGYRVNSKTATIFRKWATQTLKQHITKGYTINQSLLDQKKELYKQAISDIKKISQSGEMLSTINILDIIESFSNTWFSLQSYDENTIPKKGYNKKKLKISSEILYKDIADLKQKLIEKKEATDFFAQERKDKNLEGILGNVMQSVFGKDAYSTVEEKAAHLLYFVVKNHPFIDGNKRTGAFAFIWFLEKSGFSIEEFITPNTLTALTLLVAQSDPADKERVIGLILLMFKK